MDVTKLNEVQGWAKPEVILTAIALVVTIVGFYVAPLINDWHNTRLRVRRITRSQDRDVDGFVGLYEQVIHENMRAPSDELVSWIDEDSVRRRQGDKTYPHYLIIAKMGSNVVGFLKAMYCGDCQLMFVAYIGIDKKAFPAGRSTTLQMINYLLSVVRKEFAECRGVVCEVQAPSAGIEAKENKERLARVRLFKDAAIRQNRTLYTLDVDYCQPKVDMATGEGVCEERMLLLYAPFRDDERLYGMPRHRVMEILRFIYLKIYAPEFRGPTFVSDQKSQHVYREYLNTLLAQHEKNLHPVVRLMP